MPNSGTPPPPRLLRPADVAKRFGVTSRIVSHWADKGAFTIRVTKGGHRRIVDDERARPRDYSD